MSVTPHPLTPSKEIAPWDLTRGIEFKCAILVAGRVAVSSTTSTVMRAEPKAYLSLWVSPYIYHLGRNFRFSFVHYYQHYCLIHAFISIYPVPAVSGPVSWRLGGEQKLQHGGNCRCKVPVAERS